MKPSPDIEENDFSEEEVFFNEKEFTVKILYNVFFLSDNQICPTNKKS